MTPSSFVSTKIARLGARFFVPAAVLPVLFGADAAAQSLAEERARREVESLVADQTDYSGDVCGTSFSSAVVWNGVDAAGRVRAAVRACDAALSAVETICRAGDDAAVADEMDAFECVLGGADLDLSGGTLSYAVEPGDEDYREVFDFLRDELGL